MAKRKNRRVSIAPVPAEFDMTPMIDVTFQLIVFFLVANDLSKKETLDVELPQAVNSVEDLAKEARRVILNLEKPKNPNAPEKIPKVYCKGITYEREDLRKYLRGMSDMEREGGPGSPSAVFVLIRADRNAPWQHVQYIMQLLADANIAMYKMQFATTKSDDGKATQAGGN
jgi:biopolymer transport protein ExbD